MTDNAPPPPAPLELRRAFIAHLAGDYAAAERHYRAAAAEPRLAERAWFHLARLLEHAGRGDEVVEVRRTLCELAPQKPDYRLALGAALLAQGRFAEGWTHHEARLERGASVRPDLDYPEWDGGPVRSLTVWDEEGVGDSIQFSRFLPQLAARGVDVTLIGRSTLNPLMAQLGAKTVRGDVGGQAPRAEAWTMLCSLPLKMGVTLEDLSGAPYLQAPEDRREVWGRRIHESLQIGVVDTGNPAQAANPARSLPPEGASFLQSLPGAIPLRPNAFPVPLNDFADTAAVIERLKLVITVDTAVAHLAGALGKPCWLLLTAEYRDWRWMYDRTDSPWYASMRLYRQPRPGDWATVLRSVAQDLPGFLGSA